MSSQEWQQVVEGYLQACFDDQKRERAAKGTNQLAEFIKRFGTDATVQHYQSNVDLRMNALIAPPARPDWLLISASDSEVMVEIRTKSDSAINANQVPFVPTRLLLNSSNEQWRIADIYYACVGCNQLGSSRTTPGNCSLCNGSGRLIPTVMDTEPCKSCEGSGKCSRCRDEKFAGWRRASFLA